MTNTLEAELALTAGALGLPTPPVDVDVRLAPDAGAWRATCRSGAGRIADVVQWMARAGATRALPLKGVDDGVISARFPRIPGGILRAGPDLAVHGLLVTRDGSVRVHATCTREALRAMVEHTGARVTRCVAARRAQRLLTPRQEEVLARAIAEGYYKIPRDITLMDLATKCGVSTSSLSEILRRAEARVIVNYASGPESGGMEARPDLPLGRHVPGPFIGQ